MTKVLKMFQLISDWSPMALPIYVIYGIGISTIIGVFLFFSYRKLKARFADSPYAIVGMGFGFLLMLIFLIAILFPDYAAAHTVIIRNTSHMTITAIAFFIFLYFDMLLEITPSIRRFTLFFGIFSTNILISTLDIFGVFVFPRFIYITGIIGFGLGLITAGFAINVTRITGKIVSHKGLKIDFFAMIALFIALLMLEILSWLLVIGFYPEFDEIALLFYMGANLLLFFGLIVLFANTLLNGDYVYFIPIAIHSIMIYNRAGLPLFNYKGQNSVLQREQDNQQIDFLITGAFMALSSIFKELLGQKSKLSYVNAENYEIFLSNLPNDVGTIAIITSGANSILQKSIRNFTHALSPEILDKINNSNELEYFTEILTPLLKKYFPYLIF
jgi:hypothetical protein